MVLWHKAGLLKRINILSLFLEHKLMLKSVFFIHHISGVYTPLMRWKNSTTLNKFRCGKISMNFTHEFVLLQKKNRVMNAKISLKITAERPCGAKTPIESNTNIIQIATEHQAEQKFHQSESNCYKNYWLAALRGPAFSMKIDNNVTTFSMLVNYME